MQFRFPLLLACLLATTFFCASNVSAHSPNLQADNSGSLLCELPPPSDFHVIERGPTSVAFEWIPISDATPHRIKIYRESDGFLLKNTVVPAGIKKVMIDSLPANINLKATINSICEDGSDGEIVTLPILAFIMDLIVAGFQPGVERLCTISSINEVCHFPGNGPVTTFKIYNNADVREFGVTQVGPNHFQIYIINNGGGQNSSFRFSCDGAGSANCYSATKIFVYYKNGQGLESKVAEFELKTTNTTECFFKCLWLAGGFRFDEMNTVQLSPTDPNAGQNLERNDFYTPSTQTASISPNPFSDKLDVYPANPLARNIRLHLFNLSGQKVLDQQFSGGQGQYTLSTTGLSAGFYFLRIEADGEVQTLKVVKSE